MPFLWENSNEGTEELALQITGRFRAFEALCDLQNPLCKLKKELIEGVMQNEESSCSNVSKGALLSHLFVSQICLLALGE